MDRGMGNKPGVGIHFSQVFDVDPDELKSHGAFDVSLVNDRRCSSIPFLLFASKRAGDGALHDGMMRYLSSRIATAIGSPDAKTLIPQRPNR